MNILNTQADPVRAKTSAETLQQIDAAIDEKILYFSTQPKEVISQRIAELDREWDIERWLETNASTVALTSLVLGVGKNRLFLLVTGTVLGFLLMHAVQGWCPPVPVLRKFGVRTRSEIDREKFALKVLRGDFQDIARNPEVFRRNPASEVISAVQQS
jgi:hypothetical protein